MKRLLSVFETAKAALAKVRELMFFVAAMLQTKFVEDHTCATAWTDMIVIGYNPKFIESLDIPTAIFVIVHELMHKLLKHGLRRGGRDPEQWNIACDYAVNWMLKKAGFTLWRYALIDPKYDGMSAEQIYALREQEQGGKGRRPGPQQGQGPGRPGQQQGQPQPGPAPAPAQGGLGGDLRPVPVATPEEVAKIDHEINKTLARAAAIARQQGVMPASMEAIIQATYEDPVPWEQVLIDFMSAAIRDTENWARRNRRYENVILPSHRGSGMEELTIVADSSGSMFSQDVFERIAVAVNHIVTVVKPLIVRVIWADDADCSNTDIFEEGDTVVLHPKGGGGTDMRKPLAYVAEQYTPEVVLLLTDGYTPWPDVDTPYPLIIGCTTDVPCPEWARTVRIEVQ